MWPFTFTFKVTPNKVTHQVTNSETDLVARSRELGIELMYIFDRENPKQGGYTVAFRRSNKAINGKMADVAVAYCSKGDAFDKRVGRTTALRNFMDGRTVQVPAYLQGDDYVHTFLRNMFSWA